MAAAGVTESQQAVVRVTRGGWHATIHNAKSQREREGEREECVGERNDKTNKEQKTNRRKADYNHKKGNLFGKSVGCWLFLPPQEKNLTAGMGIP